MHDFYTAEQQKNPYEPFVTVDLLGLADIMSAAEVKRTMDGHILSVLLTKNITTEGILKGVSFESSEAGRSATSHKEMFELARDTVDNALSSKLTVEQRADLLSLDIPRMDVWAMSTKTSMGVAAVMFTSRYLRITKPYIILTHSVPVFALFYRDMFKLSFLNEKAADEFMNYSNTKHIEKYWRKDKDETKFFTAVIKR
ncbi:hypothetical protein K457DRAFT_19376 [Linnemannia elongata AG-77]|uniref:Uncharacterized protein n=1 Tax=Linnemannia elongata AG-77 TaxID=1314771 RepID=A0A197JVD7_9FUNG|nr:hypothetical protein K457DRAFT_19376 [Linnemannia elongata AG-77]